VTKRLDKLCDYQINPQIAIVSNFMCCESDEEALEKAEGSTFFQFALLFYNRHGPVVPGSISLWDEYLAWRETDEGRKLRRAHGLIGSPASLRERLHKFAASNIDQVILINQTGKNRHEDICASLDLFAQEVMPEFQALEPEHQRWKQSVLSGETQLEEIDPASLTPVSFQSTKWKETQTTGS
jgi:hypothetical protein